jgi:hypothetical protein
MACLVSLTHLLHVQQSTDVVRSVDRLELHEYVIPPETPKIEI